MCILEEEGVGVGTDPEIFAIDGNGVYRSLIGKLGGSKRSPLKTKHGFVQEDNVAGEFNIHPAYSEDEFVGNVLNVMGDIREILTPLNLEIDITPIAIFPEEELENEMAKIAGCEADYSGWDLIANDPPDLSSTRKRSGGGHLHISWDRVNADPLNRPLLSRIMDITAGIPSVIMDGDVERRSLYGKASCHRPKFKGANDPFDGIEYRALSNFWLKSEDYIRWAYRSVSEAVGRFDEFTNLINNGTITRDMVVNIIDNSDKRGAEEFCTRFNIPVGG